MDVYGYKETPKGHIVIHVLLGGFRPNKEV